MACSACSSPTGCCATSPASARSRLSRPCASSHITSSATEPHVVVDGSAQASTALTLSHWPGSPTPDELLDDLSAQIAFRALDRPDLLAGLDIVTNNHFDQDGLASVFALVEPQAAQQRRAAVVDVARAGDFGTFHDRDSIRVAFALAAFDDPKRSPLDPGVFEGAYPDQCGQLYQEALPRFVDMIDHPQRSRPLWEREDAHLTESIDAIGVGCGEDGGAHRPRPRRSCESRSSGSTGPRPGSRSPARTHCTRRRCASPRTACGWRRSRTAATGSSCATRPG